MASTDPGRILHLLELAEEAPTVEELDEFLTDPDPQVRRTALSVLSEAADDWAQPSLAIASALKDPVASVRETAIALLAELREVLIAGPDFAGALREAAGHEDARVRAAAVGALWRHRLCTVDDLDLLSGDEDEAVRCEVLLGFVSLDAVAGLSAAAADPSAPVRLAVARGLASVGDPRGVTTLVDLAGDADLLVRAAALAAMAATGCSGEAARVAAEALADPAWQIRQAAATALSVADPGEAAGPLTIAAGDANLDVRKAAIRALAAWVASRPELHAVLEAARTDPDADVRAFARLGLAEAGHGDH